ncbi:unnamed protein product [Thlaspi arvense]|uniref:Exostosin GT47 domain-containing protein n=1 Tax=Thlaspi arvense TaxID=13288 RepID=A0AAU9SJV6_THLAR|nr:unnamed protein product [Thlaspi arvense]
MSYTKKHVKIDLWPEKEKEKYPKNRETLKLTIPTLLLFCSICLLFLILLSPFTSPPQTTSLLPRTCDKNFTVYVYDLPKEFNTNLLQNCRNLNIYTDMCPHVANNGLGQPIRRGGGESKTWFATHQFIAEMIFHARVENHPCRTWEPSNADIFYVPFYGGLYASSVFREHNLTKRDELAVRLVDYVSGQRWWKRTNGRDHFLAIGRTAWDFMRSSDEAGTDFGANILMQMPPVMNMSVLTVERQPWEGDNQFGIPYPSYFHPYTSAEMVTWQNEMRSVERPHLFSFVGGKRKGLEKAAIRDELIRQCAGSSRCELLKCESGGTSCHDPMTVLGVMARSRFCLQAPGDSFTRRSTFDAMLAGCIPVFFSPHTMYTQYMWYLPEDRRSYSVFMGQKNSTEIEHELSRISESEVVQMRETIIGLIPRMTYAHPNATNYDLPDAVDVALEALSKQARGKVVYSL